ncbi:CRTAC1 family protein [Acidobacteria bacterium AH-259-G07]|nr:CRTAC1 family protein [Acidobacteria bacterium AH-259-G07]
MRCHLNFFAQSRAEISFRLLKTVWTSLAVFSAFIALLGQSSQAPTFREVADSVGLKFHHFIGATGEFYLPEIMGPGVALFDYDGDGDLDVYLLQGNLLHPKKSLAQSIQPLPRGQRLVNRLFRNDLIDLENSGGRRLSFTDVTEKAGVGYEGYGMGVAVGDYDKDGDLDLYITNFGPNVLYQNNGDGTFTDVTAESGTDEVRWSTSAAFLDYDRDGDLDLFLLNYIDFTLAGNKKCYDALSAPDYCNPNLYRPLPDRLFRNEGEGKFVDVTELSGIGAAIGPGLGVTVADFNSDGWIDIYVANDGAENHLWVNNGDGTFEENALMAGAAYNAEGAPEGSMGVAAGDFDNDGDEDLFMTHLTMETNTLYANDGSGDFHDETIQTGLGGLSFAYTGFGTEWLDYDNDGNLDLFIANGAVRNLEALRGTPYPYHQKNQLVRNQGNGTFQETSEVAGPAFQLSEVSRGAAFGDIDNDGDIDIVMTNNKGPVRLFLNQLGSARHWLEVRLRGAITAGARVAVVRKNRKTLWRRSRKGGSYLSVNDDRVHFGLGSDAGIEAVLVQWPSGDKEMWRNVKADSVITLTRKTGQPWPDSRR